MQSARKLGMLLFLGLAIGAGLNSSRLAWGDDKPARPEGAASASRSEAKAQDPDSSAKAKPAKPRAAERKAAEGDTAKARAPEPLTRGPKAAKVSAFTPEREAAALTFVRAHHPELGKLLERLKPMNRPEYEQAIGELFDVSESLANVRLRDQARYEVALDAWKARSRIELLTAQLASNPSPELESQLHQAVETQLDVEVRQHRLEKETLETRLRRVNETLDRLEDNRGPLIESRYHNLLKKSQRVHQRGAGKPEPKKAPTAKGESKA